jgi:hypothetical protein
LFPQERGEPGDRVAGQRTELPAACLNTPTPEDATNFDETGATARDLVQAIEVHSGSGSEANRVISNFNNLSGSNQHDLLNLLRSL